MACWSNQKTEASNALILGRPRVPVRAHGERQHLLSCRDFLSVDASLWRAAHVIARLCRMLMALL